MMHVIKNVKGEDSMRARVTKLWASDMGGCPRSIMLRVLGQEKTRDFPPIVKRAMRFGLDKEQETLDTLLAAFGTSRVSTQMRVSNDVWSGKTDIIIDHGIDGAAIIEVKGIFGNWARNQPELPRLEHLAQLLLYGQLYQELHKMVPALLLFYLGRSASLLFEVSPYQGGIGVCGLLSTRELMEPLISYINAFAWITDDLVRQHLDVDVDHLRGHLERYYQAALLPPRLPTPEHRRCVWNGEPSCLMYGHCWPEAITL